MSDLRKAAQQALDAIDRALPYAPHRGEFDALADAADALRAALAQPEPEPVLWEIWPRMGGAPYYSRKKPADTDYVEFTPLYAAPPQRKPLTEEEIENLGPLSFTWRDMVQFARAIERAHGIGGEE